MNRVYSRSIKTILHDANITPTMLLVRINILARKQLLDDIKGADYSTEKRREYINKHIKQYEMSRATLYNILKNEKASKRKAILIRKALEDIIKEKKLYEHLDIQIILNEYER